MAKRVIISIDRKGLVNAEISGVKGKKCTDYISLLEDILEGKVVEQEFTQEYYQEQEARVAPEQSIETKSK